MQEHHDEQLDPEKPARATRPKLRLDVDMTLGLGRDDSGPGWGREEDGAASAASSDSARDRQLLEDVPPHHG